MLVLAFGDCEKCGASLMPMGAMQAATVTCKKCGHKLNACKHCKSAGCPKCGGNLLDAWEYMKHTTGHDVMF